MFWNKIKTSVETSEDCYFTLVATLFNQNSCHYSEF